jgi:hypothetical protein
VLLAPAVMRFRIADQRSRREIYGDLHHVIRQIAIVTVGDRGWATPSGQRHAADAAETITSKYRISNQPAFPVARAAQ